MTNTNLLLQAQLFGAAQDEEGDTAPTYDERPLHFGSERDAFDHLKSIDWAFQNDDTRFLAHDVHPYPAKFIPQLPGTVIALLSSRGELIFDPFGGSGTTALEAIRLGRRAVSLDANPVAGLIGRVKTTRLNSGVSAELQRLHAALRAQLAELPTDPKELVSQFGQFAPVIANREKWFPDSSFGELALIRYRLSLLESEAARDIGLLALSRVVLSASFQDSETRYKSVPRLIPVGQSISRFLKEFEGVLRSVGRNAAATRYGISSFLTGDIRELSEKSIANNSVDLVVTSPPYGNVTDYHLYHRFRLLWLGHDPVALGRIEIGSHLKHQREDSGFESYFADMVASLQQVQRVLKNGRYAALVIGDSIYRGEQFDTAELLAKEATSLGFDSHLVLDRPIHKTRRSFTSAARRASSESLLFLRKAAKRTTVLLEPPPYRMWEYERPMRATEIAVATASSVMQGADETVRKSLDVRALVSCTRLGFTHQIQYSDGRREPTWQAILENGNASSPSARKDPKYVTHGLHAYKGKFYPQLAKGLLNQHKLDGGSSLLDPFCGSGTTLLEGYLNGHKAFGCDLHPLAAKIARAKTAVLSLEPDVLTEVVSSVVDAVENAPAKLRVSSDQFPNDCVEEVERWFAQPVISKLNWLLKIIRSGSAGLAQEFLEVVLSSIIRDVSHQDPTDLRIRYRKKLLDDADVLGMFKSQLVIQYARIEKFWSARGFAPNRFFRTQVIAGDNRSQSTYDSIGLGNDSVDLVLTSPPYAMALPYIDTDRLSLLILFGLNGSSRRPLEQQLIGSRELLTSDKNELEQSLSSCVRLPDSALNFLNDLHKKLSKSSDAGFRRRNMPALLYRFLRDMDSVFAQLHRVCKAGAEVMMVIGDSRMTIGSRTVRIPTTDFVEEIANVRGFKSNGRIDISVTTENLVHIKNAITANVVLRLAKR